MQATVRIEGISPLLMHNSRLANPLDPFTISLKTLSAKRKKTEDDIREMSRIEFLGGLYTTDGDEHTANIIVPGDVIEGMVKTSCKAQRMGKQASAGLFCDNEFPLIYDGPRTPAKLWESGKFVDFRGVCIQKNRIFRTRPKFSKWAVEFKLFITPSVIDPRIVRECITHGGNFVGLCDYRPRYGRFAVTKWEEN